MTTITQEVNKLWEHNRAMFPSPPRKVQITRAGGFYKARFDGEATCCFGYTPQQATKKLKFFTSQD